MPWYLSIPELRAGPFPDHFPENELTIIYYKNKDNMQPKDIPFIHEAVVNTQL